MVRISKKFFSRKGSCYYFSNELLGAMIFEFKENPMPIQYRIIPGQKIAYVKVWGNITVEEIICPERNLT